MNGTSATGPCHSVLLQDTVFPAISSALFGLVCVASLWACVVLALRWQQYRRPWLRLVLFFFSAAASGVHIGIGVVHVVFGMQVGDVVYEKLQNSFFALLGCLIAMNALLLVLDSPRSRWKVVSIVLLFTTFALVTTLLVALIFVQFNLQLLRILWICLDVSGMLLLLTSIQASALAKSHLRELAVLKAGAATWVVRYIPELVVASFLLSSDFEHLNFDYNSLYELFLEIYPLCLFLVLLWPRQVLHRRGRVRAMHALDRFLRDHGLSLSILTFYYLFVGFMFVNGILEACSTSYGQRVGWKFFLAVGTSRVLAQSVPLLLLTVLFGSLTFLKTTMLRLAVPFDKSIAFHVHCAITTAVCTVPHAVGHMILGFEEWPWATGLTAVGCGVIALTSGILYFLSIYTSSLQCFYFPRFLWLHRMGYLMIVVAYPVHIWPSLKGSPSSYILTYAVFLVFVLEVLWRTFFLVRSTECRMRKISPDLYWLEVSIEASRLSLNAFQPGQWVYLTVPAISPLERHPFTIARVFEKRTQQLSDDEIYSFDPSVSNEEDVQNLLLLQSSASNNSNNNRNHNSRRNGDSATNLRFLIKRTTVRGKKSWTRRLQNKLAVHEKVSIIVDGPFSSPAANIVSPTVKRTICIGVGSGITAPLGIASGLSSQCWALLIFVTREPFQLAQIVHAVHHIIADDEECLQGGAIMYLTARSFEFPDHTLLQQLPRVLAPDDALTWADVEPVYHQFVEMARWMFVEYPVVQEDVMDGLQDFLDELRVWRETHNFQHPSEHVEVHLGRPEWGPVLDDAVQSSFAAEDTLSFAPKRLRQEPDAIMRECHFLYCGSRVPLQDVRRYVQHTNDNLYEGGMRLVLEEEVF